jgi:hypothetical protein
MRDYAQKSITAVRIVAQNLRKSRPAVQITEHFQQITPLVAATCCAGAVIDTGTNRAIQSAAVTGAV